MDAGVHHHHEGLRAQMPTDHHAKIADLPILRLTHDGGHPDARQTGRILERLASAYSQHTRRGIFNENRACDLSIENIQVGSLLVDFQNILEAASAVLTVYEHRDLLGGFVAQLNDALALMRTFQPPLPMYRTTLEALSAPVKSQRASNVTLQVIGDNNNILVIDREAAATIIAYMSAQPRPARMQTVDDARVRPRRKSK